MDARPLVLVTNDDGPHTPALPLLCEALEGLAEVVVVVPDRPRSGCSHACTLHKALRLKATVISGGATILTCNGFPSDCVALSLDQVLERPPDLLLSGPNAGPNLGDDVLYSGTVAGAVEGAIHGIKSVAISVASYDVTDFRPAVGFLVDALPRLLKAPFPPRSLLNINLPPGEPAGIAVTRLGRRDYSGEIQRRTDPRGDVYFWRCGLIPEVHPIEGSDGVAVAQNLISVCPLSLDFTDGAWQQEVASWDWG